MLTVCPYGLTVKLYCSPPKNAGAIGVITAEQIKQRHNDIGCWYALSAADYVSETGDVFVLEKISSMRLETEKLLLAKLSQAV